MNRTSRSSVKGFFSCLALACLSLCIFARPAVASGQDPYESFNRSAFALNQKLDQWVFKPLAQIYLQFTPDPVVKGVHNAFNNVYEVPSTANDVLEGHLYQAQSDAWRFFFNSVFGLGGLFDVAGHIGLPAHYATFGLTLATWGYEDSNYLVLPVLGPTTVRDALGTAVDEYAFSLYYFLPIKARAGLYVLNLVDFRADLLKYQNLLNQISFDPYVFQRDAYLQKRKGQIEANKNDDWQDPAATFNQSRKPAFIKVFNDQAEAGQRLF